MKNSLLKVVLISFFISIFFTILQYFGLKISNDVDYIVKSFCDFFFSFGVPLLIFCCLSKKSELLSNIGILSIVIFVLLEIVAFLLLKNVGDLKLFKYILVIQKICRCISYFIAFLKYLGILLLIDMNDDRGNLARNAAILFVFINEFLFGISVWNYIKINSFWYNVRNISFNLFEFFTMLFIAIKFWSDDYISDVVSSGFIDSVQDNNVSSIQSTDIVRNSIDVEKFVASSKNNNGVSTAINNVANQTQVIVNQSNSGIMSDFVVMQEDTNSNLRGINGNTLQSVQPSISNQNDVSTSTITNGELVLNQNSSDNMQNNNSEK